MLNEYKKLNNLDVFGPQYATIMFRQENFRALRYVNLIKENRCGKITGRACADGIRQRTYIVREESTSPTIALEDLRVSLLINTHEGRAVQTFDVPGLYLHASFHDDKVVHIKFEGEFVDIMCEVNPG